MAYKCLLGASGWDAVAYVRAKEQDIAAPFRIPDTSYQSYVEDVIEDFSKWSPVEDQVGDPYAITSPLLTVRGKQRYLCNSANGFAVPPNLITDVLYQATAVFSASSEISYLALLPFSPVNRFLFTPSLLDSPSERYLRNMALTELDHYGKGWAGIGRDRATGLLFIDLYPIPGQDGSPIFARYTASHVSVQNAGNDVLATEPDNRKMLFAKLLWAQVLESEGERLSKIDSASAGFIRKTSSPEQMMTKCERIRDEVYAALGANVPEVQVSF